MRLIDADDVFRFYVETFSRKNLGERAIQPNEIRFSMNDIRDNLDNMPTIDAVEVVRCKDCMKYDSHGHRCKHWNHGVVVMDFCSRAERRNDE